jgi:hypothetical protein
VNNINEQEFNNSANGTAIVDLYALLFALIEYIDLNKKTMEILEMKD